LGSRRRRCLPGRDQHDSEGTPIMSITQQVLISAEPAQVYAILADASALSALSGMGGVPGRSAGEEFSAFDGHVTGRQIELVPGERVVQAWRFPQWSPGRYSMVRFTLTG